LRFKDAVSLSLRFGLQSMYFLTDFFADRRERATSKLAVRVSKQGLFSLVRVKPRYQNVRQDGESTGAHSIARQLVCRSKSAFFLFSSAFCGLFGESRVQDLSGPKPPFTRLSKGY